MDLQKAIEDIVLKNYPGYKSRINVVNNSVRLKLVFKSNSYAQGFVKKLHKALRQRIDRSFAIWYEYIDQNGDIVPIREYYPQGRRAPEIEVLDAGSWNSNNRRTKIF